MRSFLKDSTESKTTLEARTSACLIKPTPPVGTLDSCYPVLLHVFIGPEGVQQQQLSIKTNAICEQSQQCQHCDSFTSSSWFSHPWTMRVKMLEPLPEPGSGLELRCPWTSKLDSNRLKPDEGGPGPCESTVLSMGQELEVECGSGMVGLPVGHCSKATIPCLGEWPSGEPGCFVNVSWAITLSAASGAPTSGKLVAVELFALVALARAFRAIERLTIISLIST